MTQPIEFSSTTARFTLPLLYAGQAQKEFYLNEAHTIVDALLHMVVEDSSGTPPATPVAGQVWLIGAGATDAWAGQDGKIAVHNGNDWIFITPLKGMQAFDKTSNHMLFYSTQWGFAAEPASPSGGTMIDAEARAAIDELITALRSIGIFPGS